MMCADKVSNVQPKDNSTQSHIKLLKDSEHPSPHEFLGLHKYFDDKKVIRLWRPGAKTLYLEVNGEIHPATCKDGSGLFEYVVPGNTTKYDYRVYHQNSLLSNDPYAFSTTFGELDAYLFSKGVHYQAYNVLGGRITDWQGIKGVKFSVWAPSAKRVSIIGDFNHWDGRVNPLRCSQSGIWELFVPGLTEGEKYKFEIKTQEGNLLVKADPYALSSQKRPENASVITTLDRHQWQDNAWMSQRLLKKDNPKPINVYELHLGSWKWIEGCAPTYKTIAPILSNYCKEMGFTHVELLPISEHPLDESWGYQVSGYFAATSRYGTPEDFQYFVDHMHQQGIGVFLDWVPGHFPTDEFSLGKFDGSALYEHADPRQGMHPHWQTYIFNFGRHEVSNFLISNALFWFDKMHVDGLRVDAVASMLYLDYGRENDDWIPNLYGGKENLDAIEFFKHLNSIVHTTYPGVLMIAEESTSFMGVTHPVEHGGLGFDLKWNMGWMNDTLQYFSRDMIFRSHHQNDLTFGQLYAYSEKFILVFSHDEVVHGKGSLIGKMPGDYWQKFANLRLLYSYMMCQPGKKLLFMGSEIGQWDEWYCKSETQWQLLQFPAHQDLQRCIKELNHFYLNNGCLWDRDFDHTGFEWIDFSDCQNCIISYLRKGPFQKLFCLHHFTPQYYERYFVPLKNVKTIEEVFNTDHTKYGGNGKLNSTIEVVKDHEGRSIGINLTLAPLSTMIFHIDFY